MYVACKYNENGTCRCSTDRLAISEFEKETGWKCCGNCPFQVSLYIGKDRDKYLLKCMKEIKGDSLNELCSKLMVCGHRANGQDDEYAILYDACIIKLVQLHKRRQLTSYREFLDAYEQAKRLGIRLPGRSGRIYQRLKKYKINPLY